MTLNKVTWKETCECVTIEFHMHPMFLGTTELPYFYFSVQNVEDVAVAAFPDDIVPRRNPCFGIARDVFLLRRHKRVSDHFSFFHRCEHDVERCEEKSGLACLVGGAAISKRMWSFRFVSSRLRAVMYEGINIVYDVDDRAILMRIASVWL